VLFWGDLKIPRIKWETKAVFGYRSGEWDFLIIDLSVEFDYYKKSTRRSFARMPRLPRQTGFEANCKTIGKVGK